MNDLKNTVRVCPVCKKKVKFPLFLLEFDKVENICMSKNKTLNVHYEIDSKGKYNKIDYDKKKKFLDEFKTGKSIKESYEIANITLDEAMLVMKYSLKNIAVLGDNPPELV